MTPQLRKRMLKKKEKVKMKRTKAKKKKAKVVMMILRMNLENMIVQKVPKRKAYIPR